MLTATSKPLIIAEKPSAAQAIADALGGFTRRQGYLESDRFVLSWALGHLVEQMSPEEYDPRWKRWSLASLPILPAAFGLKVTAKTRSQFEVLARLARSASELINACDAGREGELIFRYICQAAGVDRPSRRLWVSSLTREAIRKAFAELKPQAQYDRLYQSALCRSRGDWLVGMNATRAFTVQWDELLSVGRVQTPTLALIVRREREIEAFVPEQYWEVLADFTTPDRRAYRGKWFRPEVARSLASDEIQPRPAEGAQPRQDSRLMQAEAEAVALRVKGKPGLVESAEEKTTTERPPQLYDLTSLQRDANRRFGLTAAATLKAAQALYERKLITYPRTDSRYLTRDLLRSLPGVVQAVGRLDEFQTLAAGAEPGRVHPGNRRVVDDSKVTDHHAILPTREDPGPLSGVAAKVYGLVVRRFLAQFYPDARYLDSEVVTRVGEGSGADRFRSRGRRVLEAGWRVVEPAASSRRSSEAGDEEEAALPPLQQGEAVSNRGVEVKERTTQPPRRYTEAALLSAMEFAGREVTDEALREAMKGHGLGTPATRAAIIERLKDVGYILLEKKALVPTPKGRRLVDLAEAAGASMLLSPELTGDWEKRIADIQAGTYDPEHFMADIRDLTVQVVERVRHAGPASGKAGRAGEAGGRSSESAEPASASAAQPRSRHGSAAQQAPTGLEVTAGACPRCGGPVAKDSKGWTCSTPSCGLKLPRYLCGKVIDAPLAASLLAKGKTPLIKDFRSPRTGKTFAAFLVLQADGVRFEFPPDRPRRSRGRSRSRPAGDKTAANGRQRTANRRSAGRKRPSAGATDSP